MENLTFSSKKSLDTSKFNRIGDLLYFEGPILSLFEELNSGHLYLFDWVDRDEKSNRWLIYRTSPISLLQFIRYQISHLRLFRKRPEEEVYFVDIDAKNELFSNYDAFAIEELPQNYLPNDDNFFELSDCKHFEEIEAVIINALSKQKSENRYSTIYKEKVPKRGKIRSKYSNQVNNKINSVASLVSRLNHTYILTQNSISFNNVKETPNSKQEKIWKSI